VGARVVARLVLYSASAGGSISIADLFAAGIVPALSMWLPGLIGR